VNPTILYRQNYSYVSGTSPVFVEHLRHYAETVVNRFKLPASGLVVDIGSNDGTALGFFKRAGYRVIGFDPAIDIARHACEAGIETRCEFFGRDAAQRHLVGDRRAILVNSHNACAHIDDLAGVIDGVRDILADDGIFVIEVGYLLDVIRNIWFDTIYHEHLDFHSVAPLVKFLNARGFEVLAAERISPQGGSIRITSQKTGGPRAADGSVAELIGLELEAGLGRADTFKTFGRRINGIGDRLASLIDGLRAQKKPIAGYGAPTKATTLLTHFGLGDRLDFLVDDNPLKQGLYSPGLHIPVHSAEELYRRKPDYLLILAWNFSDSIVKRHRQFERQGGRFIVPMPEPAILNVRADD
jgi:SAM-dependent methyltransferase